LNGTMVGGATFAAGKVGQAFSFSADGQKVQITNSAGLGMTTAVTMEAWIYPTAASGTTSNIIMNKEGEYEVALFPIGSGQNTIQWAFANSNPGWAFHNTGYVVPLNAWTHVVVTY